MADSPLNAALRHFEAAEANLNKTEKVLSEIEASIPSGIAFGGNPEYEANCRSFDALLTSLRKLTAGSPTSHLWTWTRSRSIDSMRQEVGESNA